MATGGAGAPTDAELVRRASDGDRVAFDGIYCRYQGIVYRFARSMTGSATMADDVAQEVFLLLMQDIRRYEPQRAGLSTYLYGVTRNVTRARLRREQRFVTLDDVSDERSERVATDDPLAAMTQRQDLIRLRKAVLGLPSRYREVVILCDLHGLAYAEAARIIEVPVGTVRSRLSRGRALLVECLGPEPNEPHSRSLARCLA
jgi:RNA polymerase sigma-70 factor (ECF subfamily)